MVEGDFCNRKLPSNSIFVVYIIQRLDKPFSLPRACS